MSDARLQAALMLQDIIDNKVFATEAKLRLDSAPEDSAFVNMLLQTSLRHLSYIKKILKTFIKKKLPASSQLAYYALILGSTEILYMDTPDYAVIDSYVGITKNRLDKYVAGFVNAVLRKVSTNQEYLRQQDKGEFFPPEFRRLLNHSYGKKTIAEIEAAARCEPFLDLTLKPDFELSAAVVLPLGTRRLKNNGNVTNIEGYTEGKWWVQDFSSALPVKLLGDLNGRRVLDLCAAPGGKTAQLIAAGAKVTAVDISSYRLERLKENPCRLQIHAAEIICADAAEYLQNFTGEPFDVILLDAPCSATGTLRRHPELVHIKNLNDVEKMSALQKQLLDLSGNALKKGGTLLYCTCSLSKAEGEDQICTFIKNHPQYKLATPRLPQELSELQSEVGWLRILPNHLSKFGGTDGFFIAFLNKEN